LIAHEVLRVLYSPVEAFKEIVKKPTIKGPLLIFLLVLLTTAGAQYVSASKLFLEVGTPEKDDWTESDLLWAPEEVSTDALDKLVGNYSVMSYVTNDTRVWMRITGIGSFDCSAEKGYKGLSFRIKWIHQSKTFPSSNATLRLFSGNESRCFTLDMMNLINASDTWANLTVSLGSSNQNWLPVNSPNWGNITGLEFELAWLGTDAANLTMKIDDLYFGKHVLFLTMGAFTDWFVSSLVTTAFLFFVGWSLYAILLLLIIKLSGSQAGPWTVLLVVIGYTFSIQIVRVLIEALLFSTLPALVFPLKAWNPIAGEETLASRLIDDIYRTSWYPTLAYKLTLPLGFAFHGWAIALSTIAIHLLREFTWKKAASISITAYLIYLLVRSFLAI